MAEKRMFAKTIIDSDAFLDMPQSTQLLYFHLSMRADDDGFINKPKAIMSFTGCKDDDLRILTAKKFIIPFPTGIIVIKHWKAHNYIKPDRYVETKYKDEKSMLELDENKEYQMATEPKWNQIGTITEPERNRSGTETGPQYLDIDLDIEKDSNSTSSKDINKYINRTSVENEKKSTEKTEPAEPVGAHFDERFIQFWNIYPRKVGKIDALKAWKRANINSLIFEKILGTIPKLKKSDQWTRGNGRYIPNPATWINRGGWDEELPEAQKGPHNDTYDTDEFFNAALNRK